MTGRTPTDDERTHATAIIAKKVEEVGADVFNTGKHYNPPFVPSSPTHTGLRRRTERADHSVDFDAAYDDQRSGEDRRG